MQWSQDDQTFPDDYLKGLAGSTDSPELARTLTYNVYATTVRAVQEAQPAGGGADHQANSRASTRSSSSASSSIPTRT